MNKNLRLLLIFSVILLVNSCKTKQQIKLSESTKTDNVSVLIKNVQENEPRFTTANISKMSLSFVLDTRKYNNISASCKIIRDTAIFVSIQPVFGIELFSMEINPDSISIFDKMNRRYFTASYMYITQKTGIPINFQNIQAILTKNLFSVGETELKPPLLKAGKTPDGKQNLMYQSGKIIQESTVLPNYEIESVNLTSTDGKHRATIKYGLNQFWDITPFPHKVSISGNMNKQLFNAEIEISRATFNIPLKLKPASKTNLTRGKIEQLLSK